MPFPCLLLANIFVFVSASAPKIYLSDTLRHENLEDLRDNKVFEIDLTDEEADTLYANSTPYSSDEAATTYNSEKFHDPYQSYKTTYGLKFDPSTLGSGGGGGGVRYEQQKEVPATTVDPRLDFSVQYLKKKIQDQYMIPSHTTTTSTTTKKVNTNVKRKIKTGKIRNSLTVVTHADKPLNDTMRVKKLEKYHQVLGTLKKSVKKLKKLTRDNSTKVVSDRASARWLNVLDIVEYETKPFCTSAPRPLAGLIGQCYTEKKCAQLGGYAFDYCSYGFGVCCIFRMSCNGFTDQDISYFDSPGYPAPSLAELSCSMAILLKPTTQQLLLEFESFELLPPENGDCITDKFVVSGQNTNKPIPVLCGINTGQHMYFDVSDALDRKIFLTVVGNGNEARAFRIKITQLIDRRAPPDCLQFHETVVGYLKSFNYDDTARVVRRRFPSYLNNLNYAVCIKRSSGFCTVSYSTEEQIEGTARSFQLLNTDLNGLRTLPAGQAGAEIFNCPDDYIAVNSIRLCGERLNDATITSDFTRNEVITDYSYGPIVIPIRTNEHTVGRGFSLKYSQQPCLNYNSY